MLSKRPSGRLSARVGKTKRSAAQYAIAFSRSLLTYPRLSAWMPPASTIASPPSPRSNSTVSALSDSGRLCSAFTRRSPPFRNPSNEDTLPEHLGRKAIIVGRLVARLGVLKLVPVIGEDLLEDAPVPRGLCHHRVAPSWGVGMFAVQRFYHA
jgi:hypothetical protein